jgi:hypothetical protein
MAESTELSAIARLVGAFIESGDWQSAANELAQGWHADIDLGLRHCVTQPEYPDLWVRFKTRGYPFRMLREWDRLDLDASVEKMLSYVEEWNLVDHDGNAVALDDERKVTLLDNVEDKVVAWLIGDFIRFWQRDLRTPRKNSSRPSVNP